jgi:crotonobetainyl-CoA:carnitine CoA-transferase CaiB-like acyl-CoA transferase
VGNDRQFQVLAGLVGHPEWAEDPRYATNPERVRNRDDVDRMVGDVIAGKTRAEWAEIFEEAGIPAGSINRVSEALSSPQTMAREMVMDVGPFRALGLPIEMSATPSSVRHEPPLLGADTDAVLEELGYSASEIEDLRASGVV